MTGGEPPKKPNMSEEEPPKKAVAEVEATKDVNVEKVVGHPPPAQGLVDDSKALAVVEKKEDPKSKEKSSGGSNDRDLALAKVENEKKLSMIKAWEESEKSKAENKAHKNLSNITAWENTKKANIEAKLKKYEEKMENKKAKYAERMKNLGAKIHKGGEEKRAMVEAKRQEEILKAEETAAKYRATGFIPKKVLGCF